MNTLSLDEIKKRISEQAGLDTGEIDAKIEEKQIELSGLVSAEGAAHLVARDLGIELLKNVVRKLEIKNIVPGMRSVEVVARIARVFGAREFESKGKKGKVASVILWDPSGTIRISLWNEETELAKELKENAVVSVKGYTREDNRGQPEIRIGRQGAIKAVDAEFPEIEARAAARKKISELSEGAYAEIRGVIVQLFESNPFYAVCPACGARLKEADNRFFCTEHSFVEPAYGMVVSGIIDDGSESMRFVMFREIAEKLLGTDTNSALALARNKMNKTAPIAAAIETVLGREFVFTGRVKRNQLFERVEFIADSLSNVNAAEEAEKLVKEMEAV